MMLFAGAVTCACSDVKIPLIERLVLDASAGTEIDAADAARSDSFEGGDADAGDAADSAADAGDAGSFGSGPFGAPSLVVPLSANVDSEDPTFTRDEHELYFMSTRGTGKQDIWVSRRTAATNPWGTPQRVAELSSTANDDGPCIARNGLTIWLDSNRNDAGADVDIWVSSRPTLGSPWAPPQRVVELASPGIDSKPSVDDAELVMVFMSNRPGGLGLLDIYMSTRSSVSDPWGTPVDLIDVNTPADEWDPFISGNDLQLFWGANRPNEEIRWAARTSITQRFGPYQVLSELGVPDFDPTLSTDLRHIMFASSRSGIPQIYEAFR